MVYDNGPLKEGDLFLNVTIEDYQFELRYGYYEETDRLMGDPVPIYPDLIRNPVYTREGFSIVTAIQIPCEYYEALNGYENEGCCSSCKYYPDMRKEIAVCRCNKRKLSDFR